MENILEKISGNEKVWYATNMENYQYMTAQRDGIYRLTSDEIKISVFWNLDFFSSLVDE